MVGFQKATREKARLRMALDGPAKSGKTFTGLKFAYALGPRVAVIDTEAHSASKYAGIEIDGVRWDFDALDLAKHSPDNYTEAILLAGQAGYDVLVIDSLSHAWVGAGGALELHDRQTAKTGNSYTAWAAVTPMQVRMVEAILRSPCHVIATMRSKQEYVIEQNERGKAVPRKVGMEPVQRQGIEYEFDILGSLDQAHTLTISGSRCPHKEVDGAVVVKPGAAFMVPIVEWLREGVDAPEGYYSARPEDLKAAQKLHDQAAPPDAKELMRRAAASMAAKAEEVPQAPSPKPPASMKPLPESPEAKAGRQALEESRMAKIWQVITDLQAGNKTVWVAVGEVAAKSSLLVGEVAALAKKHKHLLEIAEGHIRFAATAPEAESTAPASPAPAALEQDAPEAPVTQHRLRRLKGLYDRLAVSVDDQKKILARRKINSPRSLTNAQADELISKLVAKETGLSQLPGVLVAQETPPFDTEAAAKN